MLINIYTVWNCINLLFFFSSNTRGYLLFKNKNEALHYVTRELDSIRWRNLFPMYQQFTWGYSVFAKYRLEIPIYWTILYDHRDFDISVIFSPVLQMMAVKFSQNTATYFFSHLNSIKYTLIQRQLKQLYAQTTRKTEVNLEPVVTLEVEKRRLRIVKFS